MDFWSTNWGDIATIIGVAVSLIGLALAIRVAHGARSASQAASKAARAARDQISSHLQTVDLQRAIGLIQLVKTLHDNRQWAAAAEHYQTLREMLTGIIVRCPEGATDVRNRLAAARTEIMLMEDAIRESIAQSDGTQDQSPMNRKLNRIQSDLEELASAIGFGTQQGERI